MRHRVSDAVLRCSDAVLWTVQGSPYSLLFPDPSIPTDSLHLRVKRRNLNNLRAFKMLFAQRSLPH